MGIGKIQPTKSSVATGIAATFLAESKTQMELKRNEALKRYIIMTLSVSIGTTESTRQTAQGIAARARYDISEILTRKKGTSY